MQNRTYFFTDIPFSAEISDLDPSGMLLEEPLTEEETDFLEKAIRAARPKAIVLPVDVVHENEKPDNRKSDAESAGGQLGDEGYPDSGDGKVISVGGQAMDSVVLDRNLKGLHRGFLYIATCGTELDDLSAEADESLWYILYQLRMRALGEARKYMMEQMKTLFDIRKLGSMNPGSLPEWPIQEQKKVFAILGEDAAKIGVTLGDTMFMHPMETSSGLLFETEKEYKNCMICTRLDCVGRQAPYDAELAERFRGSAVG